MAEDRNEASRNETGGGDRLRGRIDAGRTGDKIGVTDPAAAPLGTDTEASESQDEQGLREAREAGRRPPGPSAG